MFIDEKSLDDLKRNFQNSHASVMITNKNSVIEYVNSQFEKRTGYDSSEVIGKKASILKSNDTNSEKYTNLWQTILRGKIWSGEFKNKKKNGELFWEYSTIYPIVNEDKEIIRFIAIKEDITAIKKMDDEIKKEKIKRKIQLVMKYNFLNRISHEIRTPVNIMLSFTNLFKNNIDPAKINEFSHYLIILEELNQKIIHTIDFLLYISELKPKETDPKLNFLKSDFLDVLVDSIKIPTQTILGISLALESKCNFKLENDLKIIFEMMVISCHRVVAIIDIVVNSRDHKDEMRFIQAVTEKIDKVKESFDGDADNKIFQLPNTNLPDEFPGDEQLNKRKKIYTDITNNKGKEAEWLNELFESRKEESTNINAFTSESKLVSNFDNKNNSDIYKKNKYTLIEKNKIKNYTIITVKYEHVDFKITHSIEKFIQRNLKEGSEKIIFDFSKTKKIDSCLWGLFIKLLKQKKFVNSNVVLVCNYNKQSNTFISSQLDHFFTVFSTLQDALNSKQYKISS